MVYSRNPTAGVSRLAQDVGRDEFQAALEADVVFLLTPPDEKTSGICGRFTGFMVLRWVLRGDLTDCLGNLGKVIG